MSDDLLKILESDVESSPVVNQQMQNLGIQPQAQPQPQPQAEAQPSKGLARKTFDTIFGENTLTGQVFDSRARIKKARQQALSGLTPSVEGFSEYDAIEYAGILGLKDTYRGVKQLIGINEFEMAKDQKILRQLMESPEYGSKVKAAYIGGLIADPVGWVVPIGKFVQGAKWTYNVGKLAKSGALWGGTAGYLGYVDEETTDRITNAIGGSIGGAVLAPGLGFGLQGLKKSAVAGKNTLVDVVKDITPDEVLTQGDKIVKDLTGVVPRISAPVKKFFGEQTTLSRNAYRNTLSKIHKGVFGNPVPSLGALATYWVADEITSQQLDKHHREIWAENNGEVDKTFLTKGFVGASAETEKTLIPAIAAGAAFLAGKKIGKTSAGETAQNYIGKFFIDNFGLDKDYINLKKFRNSEANEFRASINDIVADTRKLQKESPEAAKIFYNFLDTGDRFSLDKAIKEGRINATAVDIGERYQKTIGELGQRLVDLGLLDPKIYNDNLNKYIHRTYLRKMPKDSSDAYQEAIKNNIKGRLGPLGNELKARGKLQEIKFSDIGSKQYKELTDAGFTPFTTYKKNNIKWQVMRKQLNVKQRKYLHEIEDAAFAISETGRLMTNDLAAYRFFNDIGKRFAIDADTFNKLEKQYNTIKDPVLRQQSLDELKTYAKVSDAKIKDTLIPKFGDELQGKYIPENIYKDIVFQRRFSKAVFESGEYTKEVALISKNFNKLNSLWKRTVTSWNPLVHMNNTMANFILLDGHDVALKYWWNYGSKIMSKSGREKLSNNAKYGDIMAQVDKYGLFDASLARQELGLEEGWGRAYLKTAKFKDKFKNADKDNPFTAIETAQDIGLGFAEYALKFPKAADKFFTRIYGSEDAMFRVALYVDRLDKSYTPFIRQMTSQGIKKGSKEFEESFEIIRKKAASEARKAFVDYDISAPFVKLMRIAPIPFIAYPYRIIPILSEIAITKPHKFAKWATVGVALNYAGREKSIGEEKEERALISKQHQQHLFGVLPVNTYIKLPDSFSKAFTLGLDRDPFTKKLIPNRSLYWDTNRFVPGGDVFQQTMNEKDIPFLPVSFQFNGGLIGHLTATIAFGRESYTGQPLEDLGIETFGEKTKYAMQRLVPNNPLFSLFGDADSFGSWSSKKIIKAARGVENPYTESLPILMAISQVVGLKFYPFEPRKKGRQLSANLRRDLNKAKATYRKQAKRKARNEISRETFIEDTLDFEEDISKAFFKYFKPLYKLGFTDPKDIIYRYDKRVSEKERGK